jgi:hypothetical protein
MLRKEYIYVGELGFRIHTASIRTIVRSHTGEKFLVTLRCVQIVWYYELSLSTFQYHEHEECTMGDV